MKLELPNHLRIPLLILGMISLVVGTLAGVARLGWPVPAFGSSQIVHHGILMVPAFFGAVIGLERAVAIGRLWAYAAPLLSGVGGVILIVGADPVIAKIFLCGGSIVFVAASCAVLNIQKALHNWILLMGAIGLLIGNLLLVFELHLRISVLWWMIFLVLTIAGERLELSRLVIRSDKKRQALAVLCMITFLGALLSAFDFNFGEFCVALGVLSIAVWLVSYDIARRTVFQTGLPRFTAVCMLCGYAWLFFSAFLLIMAYLELGDITRDAPYHALFLGFVFSMVLGHALIIFPAVTRLKIPYSAVFYLPLLFLHVTLVVRVFGNLGLMPEVYALGGLLNALSLAVFVATMVYSIFLGFRARTMRQ